MSANKMKLLDGEVVLYHHQGGEQYYVRFKNEYGDTRYVKKSLKTKSYEVAVERARKLYLNHIALAGEGINPKSLSWDDAVALYLPRFDKTTATKLFIQMNKTYFAPYFSKFKSVKDIKSQDIEHYFKWRCDYWKTNKKKQFGFYAETPSPETLVKDRRFINLIFRLLNEENRLINKPLVPRMERIRSIHKNAGGSQSQVKNRRPAMSPTKYFDWQQHLRSKIAKLNKWKPSVQKLNNLRLLLWITIIGNTGIRPQELKLLRFGDIMRLQGIGADGRPQTIIVLKIRSAIAKTNRYRQAPSVENDALWQYLDWWKELNKEVLGIVMTEETLVFPKKRYRNDKAEYLNLPICMIYAVKSSLKELGFYQEQNNDGNVVTLSSYSLRSMYITERVKEGVPPNIIAKACGTSTDMIAKHYDGSEATDFLHYLMKKTSPTNAKWHEVKS